QTGFSFISKIDAATTWTRQRQQFSAATTTLTPAGRPDHGVTLESSEQEVPILSAQLGLGWQPPRYPNVNLYVGYLYEAWWNVFRNSNAESSTRGFFDNQGVVFQAGVNF